MATEIRTSPNRDTIIRTDEDTLLIETATTDAPEEGRKKVYIVLSQTGTVLSRILRFWTGDSYNHSSIALTEDLQTMYSFGRLHPYNPFHGGFVQESPAHGTFKRFKNTRVMVVEAEVTDKAYGELCEHIRAMLKARTEYHYNYVGLLLAAIRIHRAKRNCYYCSEFVRAMAIEAGVEGAETIPAIVKPMRKIYTSLRL